MDVSAPVEMKHYSHPTAGSSDDKDKHIADLTKQLKAVAGWSKMSLKKCSDMNHLELAKRVTENEKSIAERDDALRELNRILDKERDQALQIEKNLREEVLDLQRQLDECPKPEDMESMTNEVTLLQQAVLDYQAKYEEAKRQLAAKQAEVDNNFSYAAAGKFKKGSRQKEAQLAEQVVNLQFQVYYGNSKKDEEIDDLRQKLNAALQSLETATHDNVEVDRLKKKFVSFKDKEIEDWLFAGDLAEAL